MSSNNGRVTFMSCLLVLTMFAALAGCSKNESETGGKTRAGKAEFPADKMIQLLREESQNITEHLKSVRDRMEAARPFDIPMFEEAGSGIFMKIKEDTKRIAALRVQEIAARAAVELAEKEDLRGSPEVLSALDADLELRALMQSKAYMEIKYAELDPEQDSAKAIKKQIDAATKRIADAQETLIEKTLGSVKANRQAVLASIQEQLRSLFMSLEDSETRLKDNEKALDVLRQLRIEEQQLMERNHRLAEKILDVRLQQIVAEYEQQK